MEGNIHVWVFCYDGDFTSGSTNDTLHHTMSVWKFQLLPSTRNALGAGFRMDEVGAAFERQVDGALRYPFKFHKINKLVLELGAASPPKTDYVELLGVAVKQCPTFDLDRYSSAPEIERQEMLKTQTIQVFDWLIKNFPDAQFAEAALKNLGWQPGVQQ